MSAHAAKRRIVEFSSQGDKFLVKYEELKLRQARNLDPLVYLLSKMTEDVGLMAYLYRIRGPPETGAREDRSEVKVLDVVEGQVVQLPEQGGSIIGGGAGGGPGGTAAQQGGSIIGGGGWGRASLNKVGA